MMRRLEHAVGLAFELALEEALDVANLTDDEHATLRAALRDQAAPLAAYLAEHADGTLGDYLRTDTMPPRPRP